MGTKNPLVFLFILSLKRRKKEKMALSHFLLAFLAIGAVAAEEEEYIEGLSADEILNTEFEVEYSNDDRTIDEIIAAAGTAEGAAKAAGENQEINYDMDMNMDPMQYEVEYGKLAGFAGAGMASNWYMAQGYHPLQNFLWLYPNPTQYHLPRNANVDEKDLHQIRACRFQRGQIYRTQPLHHHLQRTGLLLQRRLQPSFPPSVPPSPRLHSARNRCSRVGPHHRSPPRTMQTRP